MVAGFVEEEQIEVPKDSTVYTYDDILGKEFKLVNSADYYEYDNSYHVWKDRSGDQTYMDKVVKNAEPIRIVGIVQPVKDANGAALMSGINYPASLTKTCRRRKRKNSKNSQRSEGRSENENVLQGEHFGTEKCKGQR